MTTDLTIKWIIEELKKSGCNSKQVVIDKLESASHKELYELSEDAKGEIYRRYLFKEEK